MCAYESVLLLMCDLAKQYAYISVKLCDWNGIKYAKYVLQLVLKMYDGQIFTTSPNTFRNVFVSSFMIFLSSGETIKFVTYLLILKDIQSRGMNANKSSRHCVRDGLVLMHPTVSFYEVYYFESMRPRIHVSIGSVFINFVLLWWRHACHTLIQYFPFESRLL